MLSLRNIEQTVATLWLNPEARTWLLSNRQAPPPPCLRAADSALFDEIDCKGVVLYSELMNFGHHDVMQSVYPCCRKLLGQHFDDLVDDYLLRFPPDHFNFNRLCSKLPQYLSLYGGELLAKYPWLPELADYEWTELLKMEEDVEIIVHRHEELTSLEDLMGLSPVVNPTLSLRRFRFDVLSIAERLEKGSKLGKIKAKEVSIAVFRHPEDHLCRFVELGAAAFHLVAQADGGNTQTYAALLKDCLPLVGSADAQQATVSVLNLFEELQQLKVFVGSQHASQGDS